MPYRAIILPCLFPCGATLGVNMYSVFILLGFYPPCSDTSSMSLSLTSPHLTHMPVSDPCHCGCCRGGPPGPGPGSGPTQPRSGSHPARVRVPPGPGPSPTRHLQFPRGRVRRTMRATVAAALGPGAVRGPRLGWGWQAIGMGGGARY